MSKFSISEYDIKKIAGKIHDYKDVKNKLVKVAFDLYKFNDDPAAKLWELQKADDGNYIVALYSDSELDKKSNWQVEINKTANNVNFYYKGEYITKLNAKEVGIPLGEAKDLLPEKLAENKKLVSYLLKKVDENTKNALVSKYPELA